MILVPVGTLPDGLLEDLSRRTGIPAGTGVIDPSGAWNEGRAQYDSTRLLGELKARHAGVVVGVAGCDLFIPVLTFVFGEAEMPGRAAIFSIHRLREEFYGLRADPDRLVERSLRELWHELGHVFGLPHCRDSACAMSPSHSVERVDLKSERYCGSCLKRIEGTVLAEHLPLAVSARFAGV